ncbi:MAG TPA: c-type cytochrome domain-containing protein [Tepidisphaeraceae bacterium]|nr:c-type cytochrome domain-containing protein [Tepidisphaeraceae bacterium]
MIRLQRIAFAFLICVPAVALAADSPGAAKITYQDQILPLFRNSCLNCHNPDKKKGGLDISSYSAAMAGSDSQKVIIPGDPDGSVLYRLVTHSDEPKMPQKADKLPAKDLDLIKQWIAGGALENSGSKAVIKPKLDLGVATPTIARPAGPPPMPKGLSLEPLVRTKRPGPLNALAASPWAPLAAIGGQKQILLYHTQTLELLGVLPFPEGLPECLTFSRNGQLLLCGGGQGAKLGRVAVWDITTGKRITEVGDEFDVVLAADISPDQKEIALGGPAKMLRVFATTDGEKLHNVKKHTDWITAVAYSPDGKWLATGDRSGGLYVWEGKTVREYYTLSGHKGGITSLAYRDDSKLLASASEDGSIKLWNMDGGTQAKNWNAHSGGVLSVSFTHDGRLTSAGRDKTTKTWKPDGAAEKTFDAFPDIALHTAFNDDGSRVISGDWSGAIRVFNTADGKKLGDLTPNPKPLPPDPSPTATTLKPATQPTTKPIARK